MAQRPTIKQPTPLSSSPASARVGMDGLEGAPTPQMLESLQAEISAEAAPLWNFVVDNARVIAAAVIGLIVLILAYGGWQWKQENSHENALKELGTIISRQDPATKLTELEAFRADAPGSVSLAVNMEIAAAAIATGDMEKAAAAYKQVAEKDDKNALGSIARLNLADVLAHEGKYEEALKELEILLPRFSNNAALIIQERIADVAEAAGMKTKAIAAYEELIRGFDDTEGEEVAYLRSLIERLK